MRLLILSDIHANLAAFEAVLADAAGEWEQIWCLGDIIGYGPDPNACVSLLSQQPHLSLSGNHDWAVLGKLDIKEFNATAQKAIRWAQQIITAETRAFLNPLPAKRDQPPHFTLAHASPRRPIWEYIVDHDTAADNFGHFDTPYCLVGHSHVPLIFEQTEDGDIVAYGPVYDEPIPLRGVGARLILNPGSVGQPRDRDPRAAYALLDTEALTWQFRRVAYPIEETQERMRGHRLPSRLIERLSAGW